MRALFNSETVLRIGFTESERLAAMNTFKSIVDNNGLEIKMVKMFDSDSEINTSKQHLESMIRETYRIIRGPQMIKDGIYYQTWSN